MVIGYYSEPFIPANLSVLVSSFPEQRQNNQMLLEAHLTDSSEK